jgi:VanZ family protein
LTPDKRELVNAWIAAGFWTAVIAAESTWGSAQNTSRILYPLLHYLFGLNHARFDVWHHYIRKLGHFFGYFVLSVFMFRAWRASLHSEKVKRWAISWAAIAFFLSALIASADEYHQSFSPLRTASVRDVILDSAAALTAQVVIFFLARRSRPQVREEVPVS